MSGQSRAGLGLRDPEDASILVDDASVHDFVEWFPGVSVEQAHAVLEHAARSALAAA